MIQVKLTNDREIAIVFYEMAIPQAMEQALIDRPGYWIQDIKIISEYAVMNGEESFYDAPQPSYFDRRTSFNEQVHPSELPYAAY